MASNLPSSNSETHTWECADFRGEENMNIESYWSRNNLLEVSSIPSPDFDFEMEVECMHEGPRSPSSSLVVDNSATRSSNNTVPDHLIERAEPTKEFVPRAPGTQDHQAFEDSQQFSHIGVSGRYDAAVYGPQTAFQGALEGKRPTLGLAENVPFSPDQLPGVIDASHNTTFDCSANASIPTSLALEFVPSHCDICGKVFSNPKSLPRHRREHELGSKKFPCPYPDCRRASIGQGFKRKETLDRHVKTCRSAPRKGGSPSASPAARVAKTQSPLMSLHCKPHRRKHGLMERAKAFSSPDEAIPMTRLATLSEISELQRWKNDADVHIAELRALCQPSQASTSGESEQVLVDALEELIELQDVDSKLTRRIADLRASSFR